MTVALIIGGWAALVFGAICLVHAGRKGEDLARARHDEQTAREQTRPHGSAELIFLPTSHGRLNPGPAARRVAPSPAPSGSSSFPDGAGSSPDPRSAA